MEEKTLMKLSISAFISLIIDSAFSITDIVRSSLSEVPQIKEIILIKPVIILCFFIAEIALVYSIINPFIENLIKK
ncbi:hypothetical protein HYX02_06690 [Candidatus Woesearchaeota archaeon]|nr:hypothetical protein [Candidatus Woesearchaeota archaeon]